MKIFSFPDKKRNKLKLLGLTPGKLTNVNVHWTKQKIHNEPVNPFKLNRIGSERINLHTNP